MICKQNRQFIMAVGNDDDLVKIGTSSHWSGIGWTCYGNKFATVGPRLAQAIHEALNSQITSCGVSDGPWVQINSFCIPDPNPLSSRYTREDLDLTDEELILLGEWLLTQHP